MSERLQTGAVCWASDPTGAHTERPVVVLSQRSIEAYALAEAGDELADFRDHEHSYDRAGEVGLFEGETAERLKTLYADNRTESYYGGGRPTERQSTAMVDLATAVHEFAVNQIREGGICCCERS